MVEKDLGLRKYAFEGNEINHILLPVRYSSKALEGFWFQLAETFTSIIPEDSVRTVLSSIHLSYGAIPMRIDPYGLGQIGLSFYTIVLTSTACRL